MVAGSFRDWHGSQAPDEERARRALLWSIAIWTPVFGLLTVGAVFLMLEALDGSDGSWFGFSLFALIGVLSGFSALSAFRDWFSTPMETTGKVARKWRKFDLLIFFRAHYVLVARRAFRVPRLVFEEMPEPDGWVYLLHYPHTNALVAWRPLAVDERPQDQDESTKRRIGAELERQSSDRERGRGVEASATRESVELPSFGEPRDE